MIKTSISEKQQNYFEEFINHGFSLESTDYRGCTSLHRAAAYPNLGAVAIMMKSTKRNDLVKKQDGEGQTPLHVAVQRAKQWKTERDTSDFKDIMSDIILLLVKHMLTVDTMDKKNKTAWDYAVGEDFEWIRDLMNKRGEMEGSSRKTNVVLKRPDPPKEELRSVASHQLWSLLVEFFLKKEESQTSDCMNMTEPSVYGLIYDRKRGLEVCLSRSREPSQEIEARTCRWIHIPANNASSIFPYG